MEELIISYANFSYASLFKANISCVIFYKVIIYNTCLNGANFSCSSFQNINFNKANLFGANLSSIVILDSDLSEVNLSFANLAKANLSHLEQNLTEQDTFRICENYRLLSPIYKSDDRIYRGGCWFCQKQSNTDLYSLWKNYLNYYQKFVELEPYSPHNKFKPDGNPFDYAKRFEARYILKRKKPNTETFIKELHRTLKNGTSDARQDWFAVGDYKRLPNTVGDMCTVKPEEVAKNEGIAF